MAVEYNPRIVTDGLVLYLDAANPKSYPRTGTGWFDLSGRGNNALLTNGPLFNSSNNGSMVFDGSNDYASSSINLLSSSMTIEITFKINTVLQWVDIAVLDDGINEIMIELGANNGQPNTNGYLRYYSSYTNGVGSFSNSLASSAQYIIDSKIHSASLTVGSSLATSYFNGILQGSASVTENKTFNRLVLANDIIRSPSYNRACACTIYQTKLYNRALTALEVQQNFNALRGRFGI
jgi:hypothetical protein